MLATIEKIFGLLTKSISAYASGGTKAERLAFGRELAELHFRLLDVIGDGEEIVDSLEYYVARYRANSPASRKSWDIRNEGYVKLLRAQSVNLKKLSAAIERLQHMLSLLGHQPDELEDYIAFKYNALFFFAESLDRGHLPQPFDPSAGFELMWQSTEGNATSLQPDWDDAAFRAVSIYLSEQEPRKALEALKSYQQNLQQIIATKFSLDELIRVGKFEPRSNLYHFKDRFM
jgi:hypothetical protein